jgi:large subunit ribosomal protein L28
LPNVQNKNLFSETLNKFIEVKVTTSVLRTIDKKGGLDKYLLETTDKNLYSEKALELKSKLLNRIKVEQQKKVVAESSA